jgi:hypothetical protein
MVQQFKLTIDSSHGNPSPGIGDHLYDNGDSVTCNVPTPVTENGVTYTCTGWNGTGSLPSSGSNSSINFTISANSTLTWNWQIAQWTLTITSDHGTPNPATGEHSYSDGSNITCSVSSPVIEANVSYTCTGWTGTGSASSNGTDTSTTFTITENSTITWTWIQTPVGQCLLTVSSLHDTPNPSVGSSSYQNGTSVTCTVTSPINENGTIWTCTGWIGTGSVPSTGNDVTVTFQITQDSTITWNWVAGSSSEWSLMVISTHGVPNPMVGLHLYMNGTTVTCNVTSPVTEFNLTYECTGWTGTGSVTPNGSGTTTTFVITENSTITWNWKQVPSIGGCDSNGNAESVFAINETIYVTGSDYPKNQSFTIYFVNATTWTDGMNIPERIAGTLNYISTDISGNIQATVICNETLTPGNYNILVDINGNGKYDAQTDTLCSIEVTSTSNSSLSMPEYAFGTILGLTGCFAALGAFRVYKRKKPINNQRNFQKPPM